LNRKLTVMVIDDESHIRRLIARMLSRVGFTVIDVDNAPEALTILRQTDMRPDVITCDISMPDMGGFEFLQAVKSDAALADIPVVMLTAMGQIGEVTFAKKMGASAYITKPFSTTSLIDILQEQVQHAG